MIVEKRKHHRQKSPYKINHDFAISDWSWKEERRTVIDAAIIGGIGLFIEAAVVAVVIVGWLS